MDISEEDYQKAVAVVRKCLSGSVSNLQRKLYWGYGRAASAIDRMQDEFIVSPMSASGRRDVYPEETHDLWKELQAVKAQAVPEGFVLVEKSKIRTWYQDDDEPENFCNSESDLNCLGDCLDDDDIIAVNIHESAHISTRKVFGVWKSNSPTDIQSNFVLVDSREKAEEIVASNKAMIEAQEPAND